MEWNYFGSDDCLRFSCAIVCGAIMIDKCDYFRSLGFYKLENGYLTLKNKGELGKTYTKKLGRYATKLWIREKTKWYEERNK